MQLNGQIHTYVSLPPGKDPPSSSGINFVGAGVGPGACLNASDLKMEETGCSKILIPVYNAIMRHMSLEGNSNIHCYKKLSDFISFKPCIVVNQTRNDQPTNAILLLFFLNIIYYNPSKSVQHHL
jgi:hypothetical protein